jgi:pyruvate dehydrogenase E2 component (dihydrolipoamide acetyltransferase)/2-oxoisovalerate dehydrogenase E2 component (dihydrolipoyl transacylase)
VGDVFLSYEAQSGAKGAKGEGPKEAAAEERTEKTAAAKSAAPATKRERVPSQAKGVRGAARKTAPEPAEVKAAPSVRRKARELGIELEAVQGSGPGGRVLLGDLARGSRAAAAPPSVQPTESEATARFGTPGMRIAFHGLRRRIAQRMVHSKQTIPHYGYVDECNATELVHLRNSLKETLAKQGVKLTYLSFFVKAVARALREVPIVNASLDEEAGEIVLHDCCHIGVAVATPSGLIVPVIHDADRKDVTAIAREIERLSEDARQGRSKLEDLRGGTFTITSIGGIGGLISSPVINHPEVGILGIGKVVRRPVYDESDHLHPAEMVYLSFSFDHRVLDGDVGAAFGNAVIRRLENPATLLVE